MPTDIVDREESLGSGASRPPARISTHSELRAVLVHKANAKFRVKLAERECFRKPPGFPPT